MSQIYYPNYYILNLIISLDESDLMTNKGNWQNEIKIHFQVKKTNLIGLYHYLLI